MDFPRLDSVALIEDDADFRHALVERLTLEGYDVRPFPGAETALRAIDADFPGVVITDLRMPQIEGSELIQRLKALKGEAWPVIVITGHADVPLAADVNVRTIARGTPGFSGADLANLVNEAALTAARKDRRMVTHRDFEDAKDKVMMGAERKSMAMKATGLPSPSAGMTAQVSASTRHWFQMDCMSC